MVDAIESLFEPVVIYNNQRGKDAEILKRFREPSWNYQVIRFLDHTGSDIIPRRDRVWTLDALAQRMIQTLEKKQKAVPKYLKSLVGVTNEGKAAFAMHCFWTGEMRLGGLEGVLTTEAGWFKGREVTLVEFDRDKIDFVTLVKKAESFDCAHKIYTSNPNDKKLVDASRLTGGELDTTYRPASSGDQKRQIQGSDLLKLDLSPAQATKLNAFARVDPTEALSWLSPQQLQRLTSKKK